MSVHSKPRKMTIRFQAPSAEETFRKNAKKAMQARTERPPEDFGASEMGFGGADMQENSMKKIRIIREEAEETFQLTVGDLKRIINEELERLETLNEVDNTPNVPGFTKVPVHKKASAATRSKLPSVNDEEIVYVKADDAGVPVGGSDNPHGSLQFPDDPYTYDEVGDDYVVVSGPRSGAIGKTIRKDATSPRMKKAHALLDKRMGKAPEVAIGKPDPGEPEEKDAKDAEGAEEISPKESEKIAKITYGKMKKAVDTVRPGAEEIDSAIEGITTDNDLYIIWREVKKTIESDDEGLFNTKMLNGLYAADYAGSSLLAPALSAATVVGIIGAVLLSGGTLAPWALALAGSLGTAGAIGGAALTSASRIVTGKQRRPCIICRVKTI